MNCLRAVFFDVYGTLAGFDPPREEIQSRAAGKFGFKVTKDGVDAGYYLADAYLSRQNASEPIRSLNANEKWTFFSKFEQLVLRGAGHEVDLETASEVWREVRSQEYRLALFPDVINGLDHLMAKGLTIAAISNINQSSDQLCEDMGLVGHVDFAITSGETLYEKPDRRIFEAALTRADVPPERAAYVGDQLESDISGAENAGLIPILMDRNNAHPNYQAHPRVVDMVSTISLIDSMVN
jgi:putative hydrolase of the HAD superfamily